eukprot:TRINITY_DN13117_c0_g1_i5.p6 TRINITY_DN13117_c0_g1~~TRINITY_DN13117_c0_g1_i5.p6  ORF type:complete len:100 (-),score=5.19 TRINITY_DN13117_c0_g1_i5:29-328(-)
MDEQNILFIFFFFFFFFFFSYNIVTFKFDTNQYQQQPKNNQMRFTVSVILFFQNITQIQLCRITNCSQDYQEIFHIKTHAITMNQQFCVSQQQIPSNIA